MSPRLEVRPVAGYRSPDYPGVRAPEPFARSRYAESVLDRMRRGLGRPLVVFGLYAGLALGAAGEDDPPPEPVRREGDPEPSAPPPEVRLLGRAEVASLVSGLEEAVGDADLAVSGFVTGRMGHLTEEEGRAVLEAFFRKNGLEIARDVRVALPGLDLAADGYDARLGVGFEFLAAGDPGLPLESVREVELATSRGDRAILVLDGANYAYNIQYMGDLPSKAEAVERLLEDVRRFFVWLAREGRLR